MDAVHERCCGLDVHKKTVVACLLIPGPGDTIKRDIRPYPTTTAGLLALGDWLEAAGCTHVAMESTGSYWKPVYNLLEGRFALILVNTRHLKLVPGRKSDVKDAEWIADLLRHGLLKASFVPSRPERELRELTRLRTSFVEDRAADVNRIQKVLEGANIKLSSVISNVMGISGQAMLRAMIEGDTNPAALAELADRRLKADRASLEEALTGLVGPHQRLLLSHLIRRIEETDQHIDELSAEIERRLGPFLESRERLMQIPGVAQRTAETLIAEVGVDMSRFATAQQLASWAGLCPGLNESAGKNRSARTPKGNPALRQHLVQSAHAAGRADTFLGAQYRRLKARLGAKKAAVAVAHSILVIAYHMLRDGTDFYDLGPQHYDLRNKDRQINYLKRRLERLGCEVTIAPAA